MHLFFTLVASPCLMQAGSASKPLPDSVFYVTPSYILKENNQLAPIFSAYY